MGFYERQAIKANKLISRRGLAMTLRVITKGAYDASTRLFGADIVTDYPCNGVIEEYSERDIDGTVIKQGDKKIILAAYGLPVQPEAKNLIIMGEEIWLVQKNKPLAPGGIAVIHTVQVRK